VPNGTSGMYDAVVGNFRREYLERLQDAYFGVSAVEVLSGEKSGASAGRTSASNL